MADGSRTQSRESRPVETGMGVTLPGMLEDAKDFLGSIFNSSAKPDAAATMQHGKDAFAGTRPQDEAKIDCDHLNAAQSQAAAKFCMDKLGI